MADAIVKNDIALWLDVSQNLLWQMISGSMRSEPVEEDDVYNLGAFNKFMDHPQFAKRGYRLLDETQQAIRELSSQSNPNPLLLTESLLIKWQSVARI